MIALTRLSPQVSASVLRRTQNNLRKFANLGIDSRLDVISLENVEYVSKLLAIEAVVPDHLRTPHDRDIVLRVCDQFCASGISELQDWAIRQMTKDKQELEKQIQNCQVAISEMLDRLEQKETDEYRPYEGDYPEVVALGNWERQRHEDARVTTTS